MGQQAGSEKTGTKHILWLDGLKGLAALLIFTHHFLLAFYPAIYFGAERESGTPLGWDIALATHPLGVFTGGNYWLCLFMVISAYIYASRVMQLQKENYREKLGGIILNRYPRLLLPVFVTGVLNWCLIKGLTALNLNYINKTTELSPLGLILHSVVIQWITPDTLVMGPFWMLHLFLFGTFLVILLAIPDRKEYRFYPLLLLCLTYPLGCMDRYYVGYVLGVLLADLTCFRREEIGFCKAKLEAINKHLPVVAAVLLILAGLYLGGYPSYVQEPTNFYRHFGFYVHRVTEAYEVIHCVGAAMLLAGLFCLASHPFLESRLMQWLGSLSFPIFLTHILWIEYLGYPLRDFLKPYLGAGGSALLTWWILLCGILHTGMLYRRLKLT